MSQEYLLYHIPESFETEKLHDFCTFCMSAKLFNMKFQDGTVQIWI